MNDRSPFESYLTERAADLDVPGAGTTAIADRARARRRRRRAGGGAVLGVAVLLTGAVVGQGLRSDDDAQELTSYGAGIVEETLDWTVVDVEQGLGAYDAAMTQLASGDLYGISTAPGPVDDPGSLTPALYRSADGTEWSEVALPGGLTPNALAADGDAVVAVGTSAAGGQVDVQLARSSSPDEGWSVQDVPLDLRADATAAGLPGRLVVAGTTTAVRDGRTVVAVEVLADVDEALVLPDETEPDLWNATTEGMQRARVDCGDGSGAPTTTSAPTAGTEVAPGGDEGDPDPAASGPAGTDEECDSAGAPEEVRTWAELGYGDEVARLVAGRTHLFASDDSGDLQPATVVDGTLGFGQSLLAGDDGFWLVGPAFNAQIETVVVRRSIDGVDWTEPVVEIPGTLWTVGVLDGRVAALVADWPASRLSLHTLSGTGSELFDLTDLAGLTPQGDRYVMAAGIGPLGIAMAVSSHEDGSPGVVLHSIDGVGFSRTALPGAPDGKRQTVNGMTMTADAVKVRLNVRDADDVAGEGAPDQRLMVGTPR